MAKKPKTKKKASGRSYVSRGLAKKSGAGNPKVTLGQAKRLLGISGKKKGKRGKRRSSSNPFATSISLNRPTSAGKAILGLLIGVSATKTINSAVPDNWKSNGFLATGVAAVIAGGLWWGLSFFDSEFGAAVGLGGLAAAGSIGIDHAFPTLAPRLSLSGRRGVNDFVKARYTVPQNPVLDAATGLPKMQVRAPGAYAKPYQVA